PKRPPSPRLVEQEDSEVTVLTKANSQQFIAGEFAVVEFYVWCGHCEKLFPEYTEASKELKEIDPTIKRLDIDDPKQKAAGSKYGIKGLPTLKIFRNGKPEDYTGPRDAEGIVKFLTNLKKRPSPAEDSDDDDDDDEFDDGDDDNEDDAKNM
ncbi:unnamed protein product, partial [Ectocarpus sp. 4 AP-2014]